MPRDRLLVSCASSILLVPCASSILLVSCPVRTFPALFTFTLLSGMCFVASSGPLPSGLGTPSSNCALRLHLDT